MSKDGTKFVCQVCNKEFMSLAYHIKKHNMQAWEYLSKFNMPGFTDITGTIVKARLAKNGVAGAKTYANFFIKKKKQLTQ